MFVLFVGLLHGVPCLIVGQRTRSGTLLFLTAVASAAFGFATGGPAYGWIDLVGVVLGYGIGREFFKERLRREQAALTATSDAPIIRRNPYDAPPAPPVEHDTPPVPPAPAVMSMRNWLRLIAALAFAWFVFGGWWSSRPPPPPALATPAPAAPVGPLATAGATKPVAAPAPPSKAAAAPKASAAAAIVTLVDAARSGNTDDIDRLLRGGAAVDSGVGGVSPLRAAVRAGKRENVEFLLNAGADPNALDTRGRSILDEAQSRKNQRIVELLVGYGARR